MGLDWAKISVMDDNTLRKVICVKQEHKPPKTLPDYAIVHQELKKPGVTINLLWQEYKACHPDGYQETQFRRYYYEFVNRLTLSMRQRHKFGDAMFVDYAGQTIPIHDRVSGSVTQAQIFVAVLGASNYTYVEAARDQSLSSWIGSHVRTFEYFKGVPAKVVCDNLKSGVTSACRYEPDLNPTYNELAAHYGTVVLPARVSRPRDKAKVEGGVLIVERWILATLRNRKFFSLGELNEAIGGLLTRLNQRPFKKLPGSRESVYKEHELPALKELPVRPYEYAQWKKARVNIDYHIELDGHYYSAPYALVHKDVEVRYTTSTVEVFFCGRRVASHLRSALRGRHTTTREHMPKHHQEYLEWTPTRIIEQAGKIGCHACDMIEHILNSRQYPEQGYRSCLGIIRLTKDYPALRVEGACRRALIIKAYSYRSVVSILKTGLDQQPLNSNINQPPIAHGNIRGSGYFNNPYQNQEEACYVISSNRRQIAVT
jgi:transposase